MNANRPVFGCVFLLPILFIFASAAASAQQKMDSENQGRVNEMLRSAYEDVKKNYYDPTFHGLDWDARYHEYQERVKKANSLGQGFAEIAGFLDVLNDSHTFFRPPSRPMRMDYGFRMQVIGETPFITRVRPGTDAGSKLHPGDEVLLYNRFAVNRSDLRSMEYYYNHLSPQMASKLALRDPDGQQREVTADATVRQLKHVMDISGGSGDRDIWQLIRDEQRTDELLRQRYIESGNVMIWKMPEFFMSDGEVDHMFVIAKKHKALILDLRGNPGGLTTTLERVVGNVCEHDVKISDRVGRKAHKPQLAKTRGTSAYSGKIIVLVDSASASAAELFARVIQLEKRGTVVGDRSSGAVMEARPYSESLGADTKIFYGFNITDADLIMADGKSLEHTGVTPDEIVLPTAKDLAAGRDPAMARAAELAGLPMDPVAAGKLFPFEWQPL
jgi:C-terminal processing protease CtpA/Prc